MQVTISSVSWFVVFLSFSFSFILSLYTMSLVFLFHFFFGENSIRRFLCHDQFGTQSNSDWIGSVPCPYRVKSREEKFRASRGNGSAAICRFQRTSSINRTRNFATNTCFIENTRDEYRPPITHRGQAERSIAMARGAISRRRRVPPRRYTLFTLHSMHGTYGNFRILPTIKYCTSDTETVCLTYSLLHSLSFSLSPSHVLLFIRQFFALSHLQAYVHAHAHPPSFALIHFPIARLKVVSEEQCSRCTIYIYIIYIYIWMYVYITHK